jgi:flagellar assembly factor FliW
MQFDLKMPLLGFENINSMTLQKVDDIFMRLEEPEKQDPSFTLVNPFALREYSFDMPTSLKTLLDISEKSNILIYNIMIVQQPMDASTINFAAPIIFNTDNQTMAQLIISDVPEFGIAEPISKYINQN